MWKSSVVSFQAPVRKGQRLNTQYPTDYLLDFPLFKLRFPHKDCPNPKSNIRLHREIVINVVHRLVSIYTLILEHYFDERDFLFYKFEM